MQPADEHEANFDDLTSRPPAAATPFLDGVNVRCSRIEELIEYSEIQRNTVCGRVQFQCDVLSLPMTVDQRGAPSVSALHLVDMLVAKYCDGEIRNICTRVIQVHNSRKQTLLHDILTCGARKLDTGTYHRRPDTHTGVWAVDRVCRWLSSLHTFQRNSFFDENRVTCEEVLSQLRSLAKEMPSKGSDYCDTKVTRAKMVDQARIGKIFEFWSEKQLKELSHGMPHYVNVNNPHALHYDNDEFRPILEDLLDGNATAERCRKYFEMLAFQGPKANQDHDVDDPDDISSKEAFTSETLTPQIDKDGVAQLLRTCGFNPTLAEIDELCQDHKSGSFTLVEFTNLLNHWIKANKSPSLVGLSAVAFSNGQVYDAMKMLNDKQQHMDGQDAVTPAEGRISLTQK